MTNRRVFPLVIAIVGAAIVLVVIGVVVFSRSGGPPEHARDERVPVPVPATVTPATVPAPPPTTALGVATEIATAPSPPAVTPSATQPTLQAQLAAAQEQARRANEELRAARKAALERLEQQPEYARARAAWQQAEARAKALRERNDAAALPQASHEWMARKSEFNRLQSAALDADANLRAAAVRVAHAANRMTQLEQQIAERDAAERERQEAAARTARAVEEAMSELAARARANMQLLIDRGLIEQVGPAAGEVRVDPLVWESMTPQTRQAVALTIRQSQQLASPTSSDQPPPPQFKIISSRDDDAVLATYPATETAAATQPST